MESWLARARTLYVNELDYLQLVLIPYLRSTIQMTLGDYAGATKALGRITGYEVGVAEVTDAPGYRAAPYDPPYFYQGQALPYTTAVAFDAEIHDYTDQSPLKGWWQGARSPDATPVIAPFEHRFFKLAQGEAMLAWADDLYRNDDPSSIRRARELYKGVLFMHGDDPGIAPHFPVPGVLRLRRIRWPRGLPARRSGRLLAGRTRLAPRRSRGRAPASGRSSSA